MPANVVKYVCNHYLMLKKMLILSKINYLTIVLK